MKRCDFLAVTCLALATTLVKCQIQGIYRPMLVYAERPPQFVYFIEAVQHFPQPFYQSQRYQYVPGEYPSTASTHFHVTPAVNRIGGGIPAPVAAPQPQPLNNDRIVFDYHPHIPEGFPSRYSPAPPGVVTQWPGKTNGGGESGRYTVTTPTSTTAPGFNAVTDFAWNLFKATKLPSSVKNVITSPLAVHYLLSVMRLGAEGETKRQLEEVLRAQKPAELYKLLLEMVRTSSRNELSIANALFIADDMRLNETFEAETRNLDVQRVDFAKDLWKAARQINTWASQATREHINQVVDPNSQADGTRLLLINAIYFQGIWKDEFKKVEKGMFSLPNGSNKEVDFMKINKKFAYDEVKLSDHLTARWVEIPYDKEEFSMIIILPSVPHKLDEVIRLLSAPQLQSIITSTDDILRSTVHLTLPKFHVKSSASMVNSLLKMGVTDPFTIQARFPYLAFGEAVRIGNILQQAVLQVDERGTKAASTTTISAIALSISEPYDDVTFTVDQPFLALIVDKRHQVPLFVAKILDP